MLLNVRVKAFTVSELLKENQQGGIKLSLPSSPRIRVEVITLRDKEDFEDRLLFVSYFDSLSKKFSTGISKIENLTLLTFSVPCISESCIEIKIKLNFDFTLLCGASIGFMKAFKAFIKCFQAP